MELNAADVKLTDLASCGGCASKYSAARLEQILAGFVPVEAENLLVGLAPSDDAAVYKLDDERALIFTLDFFPPIVDDPADYGSIAATNALNDVFAMGGTPLLALSIAAFPEEASLPAGTRFAMRSPSTASRWSAPSTRTESGPRLPPSRATRSTSRSRSVPA
jgi:selenium donor protein